MKKSKKTKQPNQKNKLKNLVLGLIFFALSLYLLVNFPTIKTPGNKNPIKIDSKLTFSKSKNPEPVRIIIPNVNIDLPVIEAKVIYGYWEVSQNSASHGIGSANPNEKGNIVIFAHARNGLFYNLKDVKNGNNIYLFTKEKWKKYVIKEITSVYPNQTETVAPTKEETLTLYTCTGFYDEKRLIIKAFPQN